MRNRWRYVPATVIAVVFLLPLVFMVTGSLRESGQPPPRTPELLPSPLAWGNYGEAFDLVDIPKYTLNSLFVVLFAVPLTILISSWAAYAMTRMSRRRAGTMIAVSLIALMVPLTALLVPRFVIFRHLGLIDTYVPVVLAAVMATCPFYALLYYWSFKRLPGDLFEAARLEGLGPLAVWKQVAMPLVRPVTIAVGVLAFVFTWGNFLDPLVFLFDEDKFTVPLGLRALATVDRTNFPLLLAGSVAATIPVIVAFLFVQRYFLSEFRGVSGLGR